jgi:hypothetical protein
MLCRRTVLSELELLGMTRADAARASGVGTSLLSESTGSGRKTGLNKTREPQVRARWAAYAKANKTAKKAAAA